MIESIDKNNNNFGVEPICSDLRNKQTLLVKRMPTMAGTCCELTRAQK